MNSTKVIKLMLIRISDEKREMLDSHLTILKGKICLEE